MGLILPGIRCQDEITELLQEESRDLAEAVFLAPEGVDFLFLHIYGALLMREGHPTVVIILQAEQIDRFQESDGEIPKRTLDVGRVE